MRRHDPHRPVIAAALIVRDEARCIVRCIESIRLFVDKIVVLDTGSTDGTPMLAASAGAEVHHIAWPDDFSIARNRALDLADADWNLILDADEWIASGGEQLRRWCGKPDRLGIACVHSAVEGSAERRNWITRLLPRGVRFEGRVHEQAKSDLPRKRIALHIGHDGYLAEQIGRKRGRNEPLLLRDLEDKPGDPYLLYQLGKDAEMRGDFLGASERFTAGLVKTDPKANWRHAMVVCNLHCLGKSGQFDAALAFADREMPNWADSPDFFFVLGNLLLDQAVADPAQALDEWLPLAIGAWERCLEIGERPDLEGSMQGCGSHLARHNLETARTQMLLFTAREELGRLSA